TGIFFTALGGWLIAGFGGAAFGVVIGVLVGLIRFRNQPLWCWLKLWLRRRRVLRLAEPCMVTNDRAGGGVRYQDGVAVAAVQLLGKAHSPTLLTGSTSTYTENTIDVAALLPLLRHSLGLSIHSLTLVSAGARRRGTGDYARLYDTLIGTPPYAGQRETWLIIRIAALDRALTNADALRHRASVGTATLAVAQRISAVLRQQGIRAKVATVTDLLDYEKRCGCSALAPENRWWSYLRSDRGWLTTYGYRPADITANALAQAWSLRADGIIQNITVFGDGTATATVTVRDAHPPKTPPSLLLHTLPGEQAQALIANFCAPMPRLGGIRRGALGGPLIAPVGPSGVLLGKVGAGNRLLLPLGDPGKLSRVFIAADACLAKRIVLRLAGAGERITVHTQNLKQWNGIRMPDLAVIDRSWPLPGTTVSVVDGTVTPAPRPNTVIWVGPTGTQPPGPTDVLVRQVGPGTVEVTANGHVHTVEIELFRAENRYVSAGVTTQ
ncbi:MAG: type VII secretion protein EccE, partial [Mycobacteriaceae bacterium]|nr:type VII secretion protein EccE [Mycobacteriaceae bacterium]